MQDEGARSTIFGLDFAHDPAASAVARICDAVEREVEAWKYRIFDDALAERTTHIGEASLKEYLSLSRFHPDYPELVRMKSVSMLHTDVLVLLRLFAVACKLPVLEIGPYLGGSTLAISHGLRASKQGLPVISIETGGSYPDHAHLPSRDIFADLKNNIERAGLGDVVHLVNGHSRDQAVVEEVRAKLGGRRLGMIVIDADGQVDQDWAIYGGLMAPHAIVVVDDYVSDVATEKATHVKPWVDRAVVDMKLRSLGVYGWGTWFGQMRS